MKLELSLRAVDLKNVAGLWKGTSDPFCVVTQMSTSSSGAPPQVLGRSEVIQNTLSPSWTHVFPFDYEMGTIVKLIVTIYDEETKRDNKPMGSALLDVADVLGARGQRKAIQLRQGGKLFAHLRERHGTGLLRLQLKASQLKNTEGFGFRNKSDPFFEISRQINSASGDTWDNVYRSETKMNNLEPEWNMTTLELSTVCGGDIHLPLKVTIYDYDDDGKHDYMGELETTVQGLLTACTNGVEDPSKALKVQKQGKAAGVVYVFQAEVSGASNNNHHNNDVTPRMAAVSLQETVTPVVPTTAPSFVRYLSGGLEFNVVVGIDFTGSNGNPRDAGTLHYLDPTGATKNDYEKAISSILSVLSKYDHDQQYPVLGFGAKYNGVVNHCFQCGPHPEAKGIDGVLDAYHQVFRSGLIMSSPTDITHVIQKAAERATDAQKKAEAFGKQAYSILLVVTDGAVTDVKATADCLARVCDAPLSIVIVGVGHADFTAMQFLDDANKSTRRDIAQFVEFNQHKESSASLSAATLKEIPDQVVSYFQWRGISPGKPIEVEEEDIIVAEEEEDIDLSLDFQEGDIVVTAGGTREIGW
ncbi:hypothetical protein FisN_1Lh138 [Fistulifera solaris]|uniref:C2 domain-containing protein n=1 Tax=Fistulifera solaris TaxID=1519565 RepID=A0A1Z5K4Z0_FISSO|nr:hypothetical protein FisN_1Lh138 [Fistulifera solaris]|eukprot:GAX21307.1 hypothetical protein FisN_1Lh138 [Fistulifera solaris]